MTRRIAENALVFGVVPALTLAAGVALLFAVYTEVEARYPGMLWEEGYGMYGHPLVLFACAWFCGWFAAWKTDNYDVHGAIPKYLAALFGGVPMVFFAVSPGMGHGGLPKAANLTILIAGFAGPFLGVRFRARQRAKQSGR